MTDALKERVVLRLEVVEREPVGTTPSLVQVRVTPIEVLSASDVALAGEMLKRHGEWMLRSIPVLMHGPPWEGER